MLFSLKTALAFRHFCVIHVFLNVFQRRLTTMVSMETSMMQICDYNGESSLHLGQVLSPGKCWRMLLLIVLIEDCLQLFNYFSQNCLFVSLSVVLSASMDLTVSAVSPAEVVRVPGRSPETDCPGEEVPRQTGEAWRQEGLQCPEDSSKTHLRQATGSSQRR